MTTPNKNSHKVEKTISPIPTRTNLFLSLAGWDRLQIRARKDSGRNINPPKRSLKINVVPWLIWICSTSSGKDFVKIAIEGTNSKAN
jgi:hypothetical protein